MITKEALLEQLSEREKIKGEYYREGACCFFGACALAMGALPIENRLYIDGRLFWYGKIMDNIPVSVREGFTIDQVLTIQDLSDETRGYLLYKKENCVDEGSHILSTAHLNDKTDITFKQFSFLVEEFWPDVE
jgi:hypothetical protein